MKKIIKLLLVLLSVNTVNAQNICNPVCAIDFVFTNGGVIVAVDAMSFTFASGSELNLGATGTINTAIQPASLDFSSGGVLNLAAGESITFDSSGFLTLAQGSNLDAISYNVINGDISIVINQSPAQLSFSGGINVTGSFSVESDRVTINDDVNVSGVLDLSSGSTLTSTIIDGTGNVLLGLTGSITLDNTLIAGTGTFSVNEIVGISNGNALVSNTGSLEITILEDLSLLDGMEISALDGTPCTVSGNECIATNGDIYVLLKGDLIKQEKSASGALGFAPLLVLLAVCFVFNAYRNKRI